MQLGAVLSHASVSGLDKSKLDLDDSERVLDLGTDLSFQGFELIGDAVLRRLSQCASLSGSHCNMLSRLGLSSSFGATVARIRKDGALLAGDKFFNGVEVMHIGTRRLKTMNKPRLCINSNMRLHSKVPVVPFFGLVHLRVSSAGGVLRRARCFNDRGIHNRAFGESKPLTEKVLVDQSKDLLSYSMYFKQVPKVQNGCLIRNRASAQRKPCKPAHRGKLIERFFHRRVAQSVPLLHAVHPDHRRQRVSRSAHSRLRIHPLNQLDHRAPRHHRIHLCKKDLSLGLFALGPVFHIGETQLAHHIPLKPQYRLDHEHSITSDNHAGFSGTRVVADGPELFRIAP